MPTIIFYRLLKKIEENDSLPVWSIFGIEKDKTVITLDWWNTIDIAFLIREWYILVTTSSPIKVGRKVATTSRYSSCTYYGTVLAMSHTEDGEVEVLTTISDNYISLSLIRLATEWELPLYFD